MNNFKKDELEEIINSYLLEKDKKHQLKGVIYSLGRDAATKEEFEYAYHYLKDLAISQDSNIRAYALLGISLLTLHHDKFDVNDVLSLIQDVYLRSENNDLDVIETAVEDINYNLGINIVLKKEN